jgi:hypothetical protein
MAQVRAGQKLVGLLASLRSRRPTTPGQLWEFVRCYYGLAVPRKRFCAGHASPFDYVAASFFQTYGDLVIWANRGGAKTELGSVTTHLDSIFRPLCQTRILGGSLQQSERMYDYLGAKWHPYFADYLAAEPMSRVTDLRNGANIEILSQSERSVRGQRVQRVKCDEVDEFDPDVWRAVQFVTQSRPGLRASIEAFSTMHHPYGLMSEIVDRGRRVEWYPTPLPLACPEQGRRGEVPASAGGEGGVCRRLLPDATAPSPGPEGPSSPRGRGVTNSHGHNDNSAATACRGPTNVADNEPGGPVVLAWCLWETIERCTGDRSCSRCLLAEDCQGRAREAEGFLLIDDAIAQKRRSGREAWESEMLCLRPRAENLVFPHFRRARHVANVEPQGGWPIYRTLDFGYANPFVCLWAQVVGDDPETSVVRVLDEYVQNQRTVAEHAAVLGARRWPIRATYCDPAGWQRGDVTGSGACQELLRHGILTKSCPSGIMEGVDLVRSLLEPAMGEPRLVISRRCERLIRALEGYHYPSLLRSGLTETPEKDGTHDHLVDALRYLLANLFGLGRGEVREGRY